MLFKVVKSASDFPKTVSSFVPQLKDRLYSLGLGEIDGLQEPQAVLQTD